MKNTKEKIIWSFSRINFTCLADFYQTYQLKKEGEPNGWNSLGLLCHDIVERVGKFEINTKEGLELFKDNYWDVVERYPFPANPNWKNPEQSYYDKILPWFEREAWWNGKVREVEEHLEFTLPSGKRFQGYIDRVTEIDNGILLTDYKVAKKYTGVDLLKKSRQLWLYSYGYYQKHGVYPANLEFEYFQYTKSGSKLRYTKPSVLKFDEGKMMETVNWAEKRINLLEYKIEASKNQKGHFIPDYYEVGDGKSRGYYCMNICSHRLDCPFTDRHKFIIFD